MKASIRHILSVPPRSTKISLKERILNSNVPLPQDDGNMMDDINGGGGGGAVGPSSNANAGVQIPPSILSRLPGHANINIGVVEVHPSEPLLCYVEQSSTSSSSSSSSPVQGQGQSQGQAKQSQPKSTPSPLHQRIIVQNYIQNQTITQIHIGDDLVKKWIHSSIKNLSREEQRTTIQKTCMNLGYITSVQFMDSAVLFHYARRGRFHESSSSASTSLTSSSSSSSSSSSLPTSPLSQHDEGDTNTGKAAAMKNESFDQYTCSSRYIGPYLIVQFTKGVLLYFHTSASTVPHKKNSNGNSNSNNNSNGNGNDNVLNNTTGSDENGVIEITQTTLNKSSPTSKPIPILSTTLLAIGCSDGAVRFYSLIDRKVVKSVRGPNGRTDPVVGIVSLNPWDPTPCMMWGLTDEKRRRNDMSGSTMIATICASGTAYIWELQIDFHKPGRGVSKIRIRPPMVKLDLYRSLGIGAGNNNNGIGGVNPSPSSTDRFKVRFDPDRQLLFWTLQYTSGNGKSHIVVWDCSVPSVQKAAARVNTAQDPNAATPLLHACNIIQIPETGSDGVTITSILAGLTHPIFPNAALMNLVALSDGTIVVIGSKRKPDSNSKRRTHFSEGTIYYRFTMSSLIRSSSTSASGEEKLLDFLRHIEPDKVKLNRIGISRARPDIITLVTNFGVLVVNLDDQDSIRTGAHHSLFAYGTGMNRGGANSNSMLISVEHSSVFLSTVEYSPTSSCPDPVGEMAITDKNKVPVYESPKPLHKSIEFQSRPERIPPKLLPSPSGEFLCLFWSEENRYEILHMESLMNVAKRSSGTNRAGDLQQGYAHTPAVDTGLNVLSFAWVGDENVFALLYPPELIKEDVAPTKSNSKEKGVAATSGVSIRTNVGTPKVVEEDDEDAALDPAKFKPRVELKVLVGVNADAAEFSGSIAAATATFLGPITLRGRHPPTCLFGGPVLCVGSLSQDDDTSQMDGMAYFYTRRVNVESDDNRASSYTSVGPAFPYPDLVVWDDNATLCAVIVGRRIAIYLSEAPNFTLLGTASLGTENDIYSKVQSAKFIHGVLYCTTETSIQCIFLGDYLEQHDKNTTARVCEIDNFVLVSTSTPFVPSSPYSIDIVQQQMSLLHPSILGYHQGSLLISSAKGIHAVSLSQPLLRVGALIAIGHLMRAQRWLEAIHPSQHERLARFLARRGAAELAVRLTGLSVETVVDLCMEYGFDNHLEKYNTEVLAKLKLGVLGEMKE